jgi:hypothetical protein
MSGTRNTDRFTRQIKAGFDWLFSLTQNISRDYDFASIRKSAEIAIAILQRAR